VGCSAFCMLTLDGQRHPVQFHDPSPLAMASLCAACPDRGPLLDSFLEARGVPVLLLALGQSNCAITLGYSVEFITKLLADADMPGRPEGCQELADEFHLSGGSYHGPFVMQFGKNMLLKFSGWRTTSTLLIQNVVSPLSRFYGNLSMYICWNSKHIL
jgi:hypothetical protein